MNAALGHLGRLVQELEAADPDATRIESARSDLNASLSLLSRATPRAEIDRILVLHAALRALVERRRSETARSLDSVTRTRARMALLARPGDARSVLDVDA